MDKIVSTKYRSVDGRDFDDLDSCLYHERLLAETEKATRNILRWPDAELEILIKDLKEAKVLAFKNEITDNFPTSQSRAIFYMKSVCQRFVEKYKNIKSK